MIRFFRKLALPVCFALLAGVACGGGDDDNEGASGAEGNGASIYLTDPEGNTVELKGPSDGKPPPA